MQQIRLTKGRITYVDDDDYEWLSRLSWHVTKSAHNFYAVRMDAQNENGRTKIWMHRAIMGLKKDDKQVVHHKNGDSLDNRRANLEICTQTQNLSYRKYSTIK